MSCALRGKKILAGKSRVHLAQIHFLLLLFLAAFLFAGPMSSGALRSERAAQFLLSPNSSLLKDCSDLMGEALEKKQLVQGLFFDVARLVDRALAFQPDVDSALSGHRGQLTPVNVVIFEQLRDILRDIVQFAKQFRNEAMCRTVIRFPIRVMLCEEIAQLSKRLRSIEVELRVIPTSDAEQRRHEDINVGRTWLFSLSS